MKHHQYFVYIVTNSAKKVLYIGVTNNLIQRLTEHYINSGQEGTFAGKYRCHNLLHYESFKYVNKAIKREKELKGWSRSKKEALINTENPEWKIINHDIMEWPPVEAHKRGIIQED